MAVIRVNKTNDYTVMSNTHFKEKKMSLKAKGLLSMMLSLPDNWDYSIEGLVGICKENETSIKSTLDELKEFGYLEVSKKLPNETKSGRIEYEYNIYETPKQEGKKQGVENLGVEILGLENQGQLNTKESNTKELNTKEYKNNKRAYRSYVESYTPNDDLRNALMAWVEMRIVDRKAFTHRALELALQKLDKLASDDRTKIQIVNESIERGWLSFFEPKKKTWEEQVKDALAWAEEEDRKRELERNDSDTIEN